MSALTVDSTGAPQNVGVSVLPAGLTSSALTDPAVMRAFGWDDAATGAQDGAAAGAPPGRPLALSARIALDGPGASAAGGAAGDRALSAASSLLSAVGVQQWSVSTGSGDPVTGFATAARADGELYARTSAGTVDEPATGLQPTPGGVPLAWDTVRKGPGDGAAFDGRAWTAGGPCG